MYSRTDLITWGTEQNRKQGPDKLQMTNLIFLSIFEKPLSACKRNMSKTSLPFHRSLRELKL